MMQALLLGGSLGMSEGVPLIVHQRCLTMVELSTSQRWQVACMVTLQAMLRGESLGMSEGAPALVEHQGSLMMIESGAAQQPDAWSQDVPAAMRTPSLEARQVSPSPGAVMQPLLMHSASYGFHPHEAPATACFAYSYCQAVTCPFEDQTLTAFLAVSGTFAHAFLAGSGILCG